MEITINLWTLLSLFTAFHGLLLVVLMMSTNPKRNYEPNRWMVALLLTFIGTSMIYTGYWNGLQKTTTFVHINKAYWPLIFLKGPLLYVYLRKQFFPEKALPYHHFLLPLLVFLAWLPYYLQSGAEKLAYFQEDTLNIDLGNRYWRNTFIFLSLFQMIGYVLFNYKLIHSFQQLPPFEGKDKVVKWSRGLNQSFLLYLFCYILFYTLVEWLQFSWQLDYAIVLTMAFLVYFIGFKAYNQPSLFKERELLAYSQRKETQLLVRPEQKAHYSAIIKRIMSEEKPYLDDQFKLVDLAEKCGLSAHQLSFFLNHYLNTNFSDFINTHRIEAAKNLLLNPDKRHLKILAIGFEAGFNSKTSFYHTFKKRTGMTPTAFKEKYQQYAS